MVSVIIPSRSPEFLQKTIDGILDSAEGEVEVIVALDGIWPDPIIHDNPKVTLIHQGEVHNNFAQAVLNGRKGKLQGNPEELFSGDFWSGQTALKLGLVDGLGNLMDVMEKEFKTDNVREFGNMPSFLRMFGGQVGSTFDSVFNRLG